MIKNVVDMQNLTPVLSIFCVSLIRESIDSQFFQLLYSLGLVLRRASPDGVDLDSARAGRLPTIMQGLRVF